jgi:hypothetical protein
MRKVFISLSKKKQKNPRSEFLSAFMSALADVPEVIEGFAASNSEKVEAGMDKLKAKLVEKLTRSDNGKK